MKKLILFAAAALALASCAEIETVETQNDLTPIAFSTYLHNATRAAVVTTANLASFDVTANFSDGGAEYFTTKVSRSGSEWTYSPIKYWPKEGTLDFYAYAPETGSDIAKNTFKTFTITPVATPASQRDFVVAKTIAGKNTADGTVVINFRHAMSQIAIAYTNNDPSLKFDITGWKVVNVEEGNTFEIKDVTDGQNSAKIANSWWTALSSFNLTDYCNSYVDAFSQFTVNGLASAATAITGASSMILVPQTTAKAEKYVSTDTGAAMNGSYIAVEMKISDSSTGTVIVDKTWCCWPVSFEWNPGYKYIYSINLAQGGYFEKNQEEEDPSTPADDLDPVLENAQIIFATVTVDDWTESSVSIAI